MDDITWATRFELFNSFIYKILGGVLNKLAVPRLDSCFVLPTFIVRFSYRRRIMSQVDITLKKVRQKESGLSDVIAIIFGHVRFEPGASTGSEFLCIFFSREHCVFL